MFLHCSQKSSEFHHEFDEAGQQGEAERKPSDKRQPVQPEPAVQSEVFPIILPAHSNIIITPNAYASKKEKKKKQNKTGHHLTLRYHLIDTIITHS